MISIVRDFVDRSEERKTTRHKSLLNGEAVEQSKSNFYLLSEIMKSKKPIAMIEWVVAMGSLESM